MKSTTKIIIGVVGLLLGSGSSCAPKRMDPSVKGHAPAVRPATDRNGGQCSAF